jgi:hypothetical protein
MSASQEARRGWFLLCCAMLCCAMLSCAVVSHLLLVGGATPCSSLHTGCRCPHALLPPVPAHTGCHCPHALLPPQTYCKLNPAAPFPHDKGSSKSLPYVTASYHQDKTRTQRVAKWPLHMHVRHSDSSPHVHTHTTLSLFQPPACNHTFPQG